MDLAVAVIFFAELLLLYTAGRIIAEHYYRSQYAGRLASVPLNPPTAAGTDDQSLRVSDVYGVIATRPAASVRPAHAGAGPYAGLYGRRHGEPGAAQRLGQGQHRHIFKRSTGLVRRIASRAAIDSRVSREALAQVEQTVVADRFPESWAGRAMMGV